MRTNRYALTVALVQMADPTLGKASFYLCDVDISEFGGDQAAKQPLVSPLYSSNET